MNLNRTALRPDRRNATVVFALFGGLSLSLLGFARDESEHFSGSQITRILQHALGAVPPDPSNKYADDPAAAHFGQFLFFEKRFSANGEVSCATCHDPRRNFADGKTLAQGVGRLNRHAPALWNVAYNRWYFWDGRSDTLWAQALEPLEHEDEFGSSRLRIAHVIHEDVELRRAYESIFGPMPDLSDRRRFPDDGRPIAPGLTHPHQQAWDTMTGEAQDAVTRVYVNLGKAIAAYERRIISAQSPFDRFAEGLKSGDPNTQEALSPEAQRGLKLFVGEANCRLCHTGPNFSDGEFHNTGAPPLTQIGLDRPPDSGRFHGSTRAMQNPFNALSAFSDDRTGPAAQKLQVLKESPESWGQFKTPSLRNVAQTAPYMHQGQFASLRDVVDFYSTRENAVQIGHHQETILVPLNLSQSQIDDLMAFLESLTGQPLPPELLKQPASPMINTRANSKSGQPAHEIPPNRSSLRP